MKKIWNQRKVYLAYVLWRLGLRRILPAAIINKKRIFETGAPLVDISGDDAFSFDGRATRRGGLWVRADLVPMLHTAAHALPHGHRLHFYVAWRSMAYQWERFLDALDRNRKKFPNKSENELRHITRMYTADPAGDLCPHQTGGAVDLTIVGSDGRELDMGTPQGHGAANSQTFHKEMSPAVRKNRMLLYNAMTAAGFQNYPGEWWHYSYGDRAWAAYRRRPNAIYGRAYCKDYKITDAEKETLAKNNIKLKNGE